MRRLPTEAHFAAAIADLVRNHVSGGDRDKVSHVGMREPVRCARFGNLSPKPSFE